VPAFHCQLPDIAGVANAAAVDVYACVAGGLLVPPINEIFTVIYDRSSCQPDPKVCQPSQFNPLKLYISLCIC